MKSKLMPIIFLGISSLLNAQEYSINELESQFIQNNTQLLASKFNIDQAQAQIIQEKLWPNPTLSISEVNLWKTYNIEQQPYLFGNYGNNQQISVELEQLIETAGKRKKRIALKKLEHQSAVYEYEELLRELRKELRLTFYHLQHIQQEELLLNEIVALYEQMNEQYKKQAHKNHIPLADFYRIQSELVALKSELLERENERFQVLNKLRILTHNPSLQIQQITFNPLRNNKVEKIPNNISEIALQKNIGLQKNAIEYKKAHEVLLLEKAHKTPDLVLQLNYDRGGNIMRDFVGLGVSFDIPIFNSNKGNIKAAAIGLEQQQYNKQTLENNLLQTLSQLQNQLQTVEQMLQSWPENQLENHKLMLSNFKKHLQNKNITLLEFIDYTQAYYQANKAYLQLQQTYHNTFEEIQYIVGQDF